MSEGKPIYAALLAIQRDLKAPKNQKNTYGGYNYRSAEDILEAVKPLVHENGCYVLTEQEPFEVCGSRVYVVMSAKLVDTTTGDVVEAHGKAREPEQQKGMSDPQLTGSAISYARKYALCNLFAIDDTKDPDTDEYRREAGNRYASQTSQNRSGARSQQNACNYTNQPNGNAQGATELAERGKAMQAVMQAAKAGGITNEQVKAVIKGKYGKAGSGELSVGQLQMMAHNLAQYVHEVGA